MTDATAPLPDLRNEFATVYLPSRNLAPDTRMTYLRVVDACLAYLAEHGVTEVEAVGLRELNGYFAHLDRLGRSGMTRRLHTHALKAFFRFLEEHQHVKHSAALRLIPPKSEERTPRVLSEAEHRRLREAIGELVKLQLRDVQLPMNRRACGALRTYLAVRPEADTAALPHSRS